MTLTKRQQQIITAVQKIKNVHLTCKKNSTCIKKCNAIIDKFNSLDN